MEDCKNCSLINNDTKIVCTLSRFIGAKLASLIRRLFNDFV